MWYFCISILLFRIYTILPPDFYKAFLEFNQDHGRLWLFQNIWSPEEQLLGQNREGNDAWQPEVEDAFKREIRDVVNVIHGNAQISRKKGHAHGRYYRDISRYVLGYIVGTEWPPEAVNITNTLHAGMERYQGKYVVTPRNASPFENWLASMMEEVAIQESRYKWSRPIAFTNWQTTDPLKHPTEPLAEVHTIYIYTSSHISIQ